MLTSWIAIAAAGFFGLLIGSFLNVVIYRLPKMMEREEKQWLLEEYPVLADTIQHNPAPLTLSTPRSSCPKCGHQIRWFENIPVLSYLFLRGRCANCKTSISWRYPSIEMTCALLFAFCIWKYDASLTGLVWCGFSATLLALAMIDWDTTLLPDDLTQPLLWAGLIAASLQWIEVPLTSAIAGAIGGYLSLWSVNKGYKLIAGKEGMGYGDFKLFAALGAWFGWQALIPLILMASVIGAIIGIAMKFNSQLREGGYIPFGPFLAGSGFVIMIFGYESIMQKLGL